MATFVVVTLLVALILIPLLLWGVGLRIGLRLAKAQDVTIKRIAQAWVLSIVAQVIVGIAAVIVLVASESSAEATILTLEVMAYVASVILTCYMFQRLFQISFPRAILAWLPTFAVSLGVLGFTTLVVRPYLAE